MLAIHEIILPSGKFARIRKPLWRDLVVALQFVNNEGMACTALAACIVSIDDKQTTVPELMEMDPAEILPIIKVIRAYLVDLIKKPEPQK